MKWEIARMSFPKMYVCIYIYIYVYTHIPVYMYICVIVHTCILFVGLCLIVYFFICLIIFMYVVILFTCLSLSHYNQGWWDMWNLALSQPQEQFRTLGQDENVELNGTPSHDLTWCHWNHGLMRVAQAWDAGSSRWDTWWFIPRIVSGL